VKSPEIPGKIANSIKPVYELVFKKYLVDELYFKMIINPLIEFSRKVWFYVDVNFIDKITYVIADLIKGGGGVTRSLQTGNVQVYAMYIAIGLVVALSIIIIK
jgi:NADH-quinone oxidoreductase subunit L